MVFCFRHDVSSVHRQTARATGTELLLLVEDLKKNCCSSEYLFVYANTLFLQVENALLKYEEALEGGQLRAGGSGMAIDSFSDARSPRGLTRRNSESEPGGHLQRRPSGGDSLVRSMSSSSAASPFKFSARSIEGSRCKVRRLRQELESVVIWSKVRDGGSSVLDASGTFALKLIGMAGLSGSIIYEILDMLKGNRASSVHVRRICSGFLR
jgi:hypothetical protein